MELWIGLAVLVVALIGWAWLSRRFAAWTRNQRLLGKDRRRREEQREWRASGRLPDRYETTYKAGEMVDEDVARMVEMGYYVASESAYADGSVTVIYRHTEARVLL